MRVWDAETGQERLRYLAAIDGINGLAFAANSHRLVAVDTQALIYQCIVCGSTAELRARGYEHQARIDRR